MPSSTVFSPNAFRSPETAMAEVVMPPPSALGLTPACYAPDTTTDTAFYLVAPGQGSAQPAGDDGAELEALKTVVSSQARSSYLQPCPLLAQGGARRAPHAAPTWCEFWPMRDLAAAGSPCRARASPTPGRPGSGGDCSLPPRSSTGVPGVGTACGRTRRCPSGSARSRGRWAGAARGCPRGSRRECQ